MIQAKITANQIGIAVDVRRDNGDWQLLDLYRYKSYTSSSVAQYSAAIDPVWQTAEIATFLRYKGVEIVSIR